MISNCVFHEGARAAIWYGKNIEIKEDNDDLNTDDENDIYKVQ